MPAGVGACPIHRPLHEGRSICGRLGLGGQTAWDQLTEAEAPAAAPAPARICAHFLLRRARAGSRALARMTRERIQARG